MNIAEIDPNFKEKNPLERNDIAWLDIRKPPFQIYGLYNPMTETRFCRMPNDVAKTVSPGVAALNYNTAGGRVRFSTDSPYIALSTEQPFINTLTHMALAGVSGFDMYYDKNGEHKYINAYRPQVDSKTGFTSCIDLPAYLRTGEMNCFTLDFPLYCDVTDVHIGIKAGSRIAEGESYADAKPFVYYGSSITQGGCASRPGICYQGFINRRFNYDYINLGFSGNARGEREMAEYTATLPMSVFICDYDHNSPNPEHLRNTHYPFYQAVREKNSNVPYIMISRPNVFSNTPDSMKRRDIIRESYERAVAGGDKNVYFIDGFTLFAGIAPDDCTVDSTHPNDIGFFRMSQVIGDVISMVLEKKN